MFLEENKSYHKLELENYFWLCTIPVIFVRSKVRLKFEIKPFFFFGPSLHNELDLFRNHTLTEPKS